MTIYKDTLVSTPEGKIPIIALYQHYGVSNPFDIFSVSATGVRIIVKATVKDSPNLKHTLDIGIRCSKNQQVVVNQTDPLFYASNPHGMTYRTIYANQISGKLASIYNEVTQVIEPKLITNMTSDESEVSVPMFCLTIPSTGLYLAGNDNIILGA